MPFKPIISSVVDASRILGMSEAALRPYVRQARDVLAGTHRVWDKVLSVRHPVHVLSSQLTKEQLQQLVQWKVIEPVDKCPAFALKLFAVPKSDARWSRRILDCRAVNRYLDFDDLEKPKFRLLPPLASARVLLGRREPEISLAELDFQSYFPSLRWGHQLAGLHGLRVGSQYYSHIAPSQGSSLLPICAQALTLALAFGPPPDAPWEAFHRRAIVVVYDNVALAGPEHALQRRIQRLRQRCLQAGVVVGDCQGPGTEMISCGVHYQSAPIRRFRLKPGWPSAASTALEPVPADIRAAARQAGIVGWMAAVMGLPLAFFADTMHHTRNEEEIQLARRLLAANEWRMLRGEMSFRLPEQATVVIADASIGGVGVVTGGMEYAFPFARRRSAADQQWCEFEAAVQAVKLVAPLATVAILLVGDNRGVLAAIARGLTCSARGNAAIRDIYGLLRCPLWVTWVSTESNVADGPSRSTVAYARACDERSVAVMTAALAEWKASAREVLWSSVSPMALDQLPEADPP